jgi:hypothetical protein
MATDGDSYMATDMRRPVEKWMHTDVDSGLSRQHRREAGSHVRHFIKPAHEKKGAAFDLGCGHAMALVHVIKNGGLGRP